MAKIVATQVAREGLRLVERAPKAVLVWGLIYFAIQGILPFALVLLVLGPEILDAMLSTAASPQMIEELQLRANLVQLLLLPATVAIQAVLTAAVIRAILTPEDSRAFWLRLGPAEGWLMLLQVVAFFLALLVGLPIFGVVALAVFLAGQSSQALAVITGLVLGGMALASTLWIAARFSLAPSLTVRDGKFRLFESWALTRGHAGRILLAWLLMALLVLALLLAVGSALVCVALLVFGGLAVSGGEAAFSNVTAEQAPGLVGVAAVVLLVVWLLSAVMQGVLLAITVAPFARIFQLLQSEPEAPPSVALDGEPAPV